MELGQVLAAGVAPGMLDVELEVGAVLDIVVVAVAAGAASASAAAVVGSQEVHLASVGLQRSERIGNK